MSSSELLCCRCMTDYVLNQGTDVPNTANTIYLGNALCWPHFVEHVGIQDKVDIDVDATVFPTGYRVMRKNKEDTTKQTTVGKGRKEGRNE